MTTDALAPYVDPAATGSRSTWVALRRDGGRLSDADGVPFERVRRDASVTHLILARDGGEIALARPAGASPIFRRRVRVGVLGEIAGKSYEWGACIGWELADGTHDLRWLLHDGRVIASNQIDPPDDFA